MSEESIFDLLRPTTWATPPATYSSSSLKAIKACPRRWLLTNSAWGTFARFPVRLTQSAIEGQIVHSALDRLAKELGRRGRPPIGSSQFACAVEECGFWSYFAQLLMEWNSKLAQSRRRGQIQVLRAEPVDLANSAIRLLREEYRAAGGKSANPIPRSRSDGNSALPLAQLLRERGILTEQRLTHPCLPFVGVLDLVQQGSDGRVIIVDFKTGRPRPEHEEQVQNYAVLWWRATGQFPRQIGIQYLEGRSEWEIMPEHIRRREDRLKVEVQRAVSILNSPPGPALPSEGCATCPVRARCNEGWKQQGRVQFKSLGSRTSIDVELVVESAPGPTGFSAMLAAGDQVHVVYDRAAHVQLPTVRVSDCIRLVDAQVRNEGKEIEIRPWTDMYRVNDTP